MARFLSAVGLVLLIGVLFTGPVLGEDLNPPLWRGDYGTTYAVWEFSDPNPTPLPELGWYNPNGMPYMSVDAGYGRNWLPDWDGRIGVWPLSGIIVIEFPNYPLPNAYKDIWVQITWAPEAQYGEPTVKVQPEGIDPGVIVPVDPQSTKPLSGPWRHDTYKVRISPNPPWERIIIQGNAFVDEVVVDTRCIIPEPGGVLVLITGSLGLVGFIGRRKARR